jgi:hypothetical protein
MPENNFINNSIRKESSLVRYSTRAMKDICLHYDVENYISKNDISTSRLVEKLLNNDFVLARYTDPTYPV